MLNNSYMTYALVNDRHATLLAEADQARLVRAARTARRSQPNATPSRYSRLIARATSIHLARPTARPVRLAIPAEQQAS